MPPKRRGGKTASGGSSRHDTRQSAQQNPSTAAVPDTPTMLPPPSRATRIFRGESRDAEPTERYARRGTVRESRQQSLASITSRYPTQSDAQDMSDALDPAEMSASRDFADSVQGEISAASVKVEIPGERRAHARLMRKFIDRLFDASSDLVAHIAEGVRDDSWSLEFKAYSDQFKTLREHYTKGADLIDINFVRSSSGAVENDSLWQKLPWTLAGANLASLLNDLVAVDEKPTDRLDFLQQTDGAFPFRFVPEGAPDAELFGLVQNTQTIEVCIRIRTQRLIEALRNTELDPARLFAKIFLDFDLANVVDDALDEQIENAPFRDVPGIDINSDMPVAQELRNQIIGLRAKLALQRDKLDQSYPYSDFSDRLKAWAKSTFDILKRRLSSCLSGIDEEFGNSSLAASSQLHNEVMSAEDAISRQEIHNPFLNSRNFATVMNLGSRTVPNYSSITDDQIVADAAESQSSSYIFGTQNDGSTYAAAAAAGLAGQKRPPSSNNNGGSGDFETDTRTLHLTKRTCISKSAISPQSSRNPVPRPVPSSSVPAPRPSAGDLDIVAITQQSKLVSMANRKLKQPKQRKPWTAHDIQQLVYAVDAYKAKWSTIEKQIREKHITFDVPERDQQGLRDKARLVKVDLLKTDSVLPPGFDLVVLGRKEKEMIIAAGRNPGRLEHDLDDNGKAINTHYLPDELVDGVADDPVSESITAAVAAPTSKTKPGEEPEGEPEGEPEDGPVDASLAAPALSEAS